jgi:hypothetical protein
MNCLLGEGDAGIYAKILGNIFFLNNNLQKVK